MEGHERPRPEEGQHIEEEEYDVDTSRRMTFIRLFIGQGETQINFQSLECKSYLYFCKGDLIKKRKKKG